MSKPKPTPEEIWSALENEALEDEELERAASMSTEDALKEIAAAGGDAERVKADARAVRAKLEHEVADWQKDERRVSRARMRSLRTRRRRPVVLWLAAAAVGVSIGGGLLYTRLMHPHPDAPVPPPSAAPSTPPPPPESAAPLIAPAELRRQAFDACAAGRWAECLSLLDEAREQDPAGDADAHVQSARRQAASHLGDKPPLQPTPHRGSSSPRPAPGDDLPPK